MIRRLFWLSMGVTIGALVVRKLSRFAERMRPSGIAASFAAGMGDIADSLSDFAATLAGSVDGGAEIRVVRGNIEFEQYFATDGRRSFNWVIHPEGFDGASLLELGRLQGWTLKPATLMR